MIAMRKILLVISREYTTRVKKVSFWVLTILVPVLLAGIYAIPILLAIDSPEKSEVLVVDDTHLFQGSFQSTAEITYRDAGSLDYAKREMKKNEDIDAIVYIPARETTIPNDAFLYYLSDAPSMSLQGDVDHQLQTILRNNILLDVHGISVEDYALISNTRIKLRTKDLETGRDGFLEIKTIVGFILALLIYITIFSFGSQVMRGVMEEKTNRIVEVMVSSVKPFQLMMGKVVGICLVGLTQFLLWIAISGIAFAGIQNANKDLFARAESMQQVTEIATKGTDATAQLASAQSAEAVPELVQGLASIHFGVLIFMFLFYFLFGYLLYATLFAAVGSVTDNETDSQQFTLPLTVPLILTFLLTPVWIDSPSGPLAVCFSMIPFTSPIAMMFRIPFGVPVGQLILSAVLLLVSFPVCTWAAAKIYRAGILLYGKKITYRDLFKWLKIK